MDEDQTTAGKPKLNEAPTTLAATTAVADWFQVNMNQAWTNVIGGKRRRVEHEAHRLVEWLQTKGFIIVPEPDSKPPARRARATTPKPYTGPAMIGQSHTARLIGGAS